MAAPGPDAARRLRSARARRLLRALALATLLAGCQAMTDPVYYGAMSTLGKEKRHILADRVEDGREAQQEAKDQFRDTLEAFQALTGFEGGELEEVYERLRDAYEESEERADAVRERVDAIERVADDLFEEWRDEIDTMQDRGLRARSEAQLRQTQARYAQLLAAMRRAEERMDPVLAAFRDRVLFLKHNLNARAIASLEGDLGAIRSDVDRLVQDMNASIAEAESFLATMEG